MPKLWNATIESHRREVRDATLDTTAALVAAHGLRSVTMSQIAEATGIGRATLYKYFASVEEILLAWHERLIEAHLEQLERARSARGGAYQQLESVLQEFALISHQTHGSHNRDLGAFLHRDGHLVSAEQRLREMLRSLLSGAQSSGDVRSDIPTSELLDFCLHALGAARSSTSEAAAQRIVSMTLGAIRTRVPST